MFSIITFIITISVVVVFHEYGHYLAARFYGVHVERFSLGFGKVLYRCIDKKGTEWVVSMLPLGGYVKPLAEPRPDHSDFRRGESVAEKSAFQKIVIYAAGPIFSFLLGVLIYTGIFMVGEEQPKAIIAAPTVNSVAAQAGLRAGDRIVAIDTQGINSWPEAMDKLIASMALGKSVAIKVVSTDDIEREVRLTPPITQANLEQVNWLNIAGIALQESPPIVVRVLPNGVAEKAGLKAGDKVLSLNDITVQHLADFIQHIQSSANQSIRLRVDREGTILNLVMTPTEIVLADGNKIGRIQSEFQANYATQYISYGFIEALFKAMTKTTDTALFSFKMIGKMITGEVSFSNLTGPITIADYSGKVAEHGLGNFIQFIALISISIGVLNLLPIPGLDGGQMVLNFIELIMGRPLPEGIFQGLMKVGYGLLLLLMIFAFHNDLMRLFY